MTETASTRRRSGAASDSPVIRARHASPSGPPSATAGAITEASTTSTFVRDGGDRIRSRESALRSVLDPGDHVVDCRGRHHRGQLGREVLLQRLTGELGSSYQFDVHIFGYVPDLNIRHACIIHAPGVAGRAISAADCESAGTGCPGDERRHDVGVVTVEAAPCSVVAHRRSRVGVAGGFLDIAE